MASRHDLQSLPDPRLIELLKQELFAYREGLSAPEQCDLAYERLLAIGRRSGLTRADILETSDRLLSLHELVGPVDGVTATILSIHYNLCAGALLEHADLHGRRDLEPLVDELLRFDSIGAYLATELGYGNNLFSLRTEARFSERTGEFVLHTPCPQAVKFMPNTAHPKIPKLAIVLARLIDGDRDCGIFQFVVRIRGSDGALAAGVRVRPLGEKPAYALDNAVTSFDRVRLPFASLLSEAVREPGDIARLSSSPRAHKERFEQAIRRVQNGRICLSSIMLNSMKSAVSDSIRFSSRKRTFAPEHRSVPLIAYRNQQKALYTALAKAFACSTLVEESKSAFRAGRGGAKPDRADADRAAALAKAYTSQSELEVFQACRERVGAHGLFSANKIITSLNQVQGILTAEGDNPLILMKLAQDLLKASKDGAGDRGAPSGFRAALGWCARLLGRRASLSDPHEQQRLLLRREQKLRRKISFSFRKRLLLSRDLFASWNAHVISAIELGEAHALRKAHRSLLAASQDLPALAPLCGLLFLEHLERRASGFVSFGLVSRRRLRAAESMLDALLEEVDQSRALLLTELGLPEGPYSTPLGGDFVAFYGGHVKRDSELLACHDAAPQSAKSSLP